jgi:hypothetical protein
VTGRFPRGRRSASLWLRVSRFGGGVLAAALLCAPASAHTRSQSYSNWSTSGATLTGVFQVDAQRVTQLDDRATFDTLGAVLATHLAQTVHVTQAGARCAATSPQPLVAARGDVRVELVFACPRPLSGAPATITMGAFFEASPSHVHYARVSREGGEPREVLATVRSHTFDAGGHAAAAPTDFAAFFDLGLEHVLSGVDHLAFLAALALLAGGLARAAWAATGFTLGHSLTLGLVALGWLRPDSRSVEALIGFTVAFAAGEAFASRAGAAPRLGWAALALVAAVPLTAKITGASMLPWAVVTGIAAFALCAGGLGGATSRRLAPLLATAFGLAHGAGFAGALLALDIPRARLLTALFGFNLGVEAAQLLALAVLAAIALCASRLPGPARRRAVDYATVSLFALGVYWFVGRSLTLA